MLPRRIVVAVLRRDPGEIERRARAFRIHTEEGRALVSRLGEAFLGGFNAMLEARSSGDVAERGMRVDPHFRPFFFEGAAMGYLPRGWHARGCDASSAERELLRMHPAFRYLYYVGLGFWFGFRHRGRPSRIERLAPHIDPMYLPLCADGFGFKVGFFEGAERRGARQALLGAPDGLRPFFHQGLGRALFFAHMDDEPGFDAEKARAPEFAADLEFGRSLALAFTGVDRPQRIVRHLAEARGGAELSTRLTGTTWALAAREMNDPEYFHACLASADEPTRRLLARLPVVCRAAFDRSRSYAEWQARTRREVMREWRGRDGDGVP